MRWWPGFLIVPLFAACCTTVLPPQAKPFREQTTTESEVKIEHKKAEIGWWETYVKMMGVWW